jgi:tripartite-type tricarboxylate transporter receptor subunit TctC
MKRTALLFAALVLAAAPAWAVDWPTRTVKLVVGAVPGGAPDIIARLLGEKLAASLGQAFVIDNRPGAGGTTATAQLVKTAPDGYTILVADIGQLVIAPYLMSDVTYDPTKDLAAIALVAITPLFIVANEHAPYKTITELIEQAKANSGKINYGSSGVGSIHHIAMEVFKAQTGVDIVHVPFKGSGQSVPALLAGEVPVVVATLPTVGSYVQANRARLLAATSLQRFPDAPDVPALSELPALKGYDYASEIGFVAPAGTPHEIVEKLADAIHAVLDTPEMRARFKTLGSVPAFAGPEEYAQNIKNNFAKYREAVRISGARQN